MCNINIAINKNGKNTKKIPEYMNTASYNSFMYNNDGEGAITIKQNGETKTQRSIDKIRYKEPCRALITHQRMTTSGTDKKNLHPQETKDLLIMHNGVMNCDKPPCSDTRIYTQKLQELYNTNKPLKDCIKILSAQISGSYSIVIYDKKQKTLIYYKEPTTRFYKIENKDWLILSTSEENIEYAKFYFGIDNNRKQIKPNVIYDLLNCFNRIGSFKPKRTEYQFYKNLSSPYNNGWDEAQYNYDQRTDKWIKCHNHKNDYMF